MFPSSATMALRQDREPKRGTASPTRRYLCPFVLNTSVTHIDLRGKSEERGGGVEKVCMCVLKEKGGVGRQSRGRNMACSSKAPNCFAILIWMFTLLQIPNTHPAYGVIYIFVVRPTHTHARTHTPTPNENQKKRENNATLQNLGGRQRQQKACCQFVGDVYWARLSLDVFQLLHSQTKHSIKWDFEMCCRAV